MKKEISVDNGQEIVAHEFTSPGSIEIDFEILEGAGTITVYENGRKAGPYELSSAAGMPFHIRVHTDKTKNSECKIIAAGISPGKSIFQIDGLPDEQVS